MRSLLAERPSCPAIICEHLPIDFVTSLFALEISNYCFANMAEMELQSAHEAKDYELQSHGFKTFSRDNDEQQFDVLTRLGKVPVLKVSFQSRYLGKPCGADIDSAILASWQSWASRVPF